MVSGGRGVGRAVLGARVRRRSSAIPAIRRTVRELLRTVGLDARSAHGNSRTCDGGNPQTQRGAQLCPPKSRPAAAASAGGRVGGRCERPWRRCTLEGSQSPSPALDVLRLLGHVSSAGAVAFGVLRLLARRRVGRVAATRNAGGALARGGVRRNGPGRAGGWRTISRGSACRSAIRTLCTVRRRTLACIVVSDPETPRRVAHSRPVCGPS